MLEPAILSCILKFTDYCSMHKKNTTFVGENLRSQIPPKLQKPQMHSTYSLNTLLGVASFYNRRIEPNTHSSPAIKKGRP
jgi:hypothetical protein